MKILVIEDNKDTVEFIKFAFSAGWPDLQVITAYKGIRGIELIKLEKPEIVLLDLGLPDISGFDVIKKIREFSVLPIIVITVMDSEPDIVKAMELGADEYLTKPFGQMEIVARIKAFVRREQSDKQSTSEYEVGPWRFNPQRNLLYNKTYEVSLTSTENLILLSLISNRGKVITFHNLSESIWGIDYPNSVNAIRVHISRLRQKIERAPGYCPIINLKFGVGYYIE